MALASRVDTSGDGTLHSDFDGHELWLGEHAAGTRGVIRPKLEARRAWELRARLARAAGVGEAAVTVQATDGSPGRAEIDLPARPDEPAKKLIARWLDAARRAAPLAAEQRLELWFDIGPIKLEVRWRKDPLHGARYVSISGETFTFVDPDALRLRLRDPRQLTIHGWGDDRVKLTGVLENTAELTTPPITVFARAEAPGQARREIVQELGAIAPSGRAPFTLETSQGIGEWVQGPAFRTGTTRIPVFNAYSEAVGESLLEVALRIHREYGAWPHRDYSLWRLSVSIPTSLADGPEAERTAKLQSIVSLLREHVRRFGTSVDVSLLQVSFVKPGGGGWTHRDGKLEPLARQP
jgi:hypothetical protein